MNAIIQFHKKKYETPLEMLGRLRMERPELRDEKLSYLGRLDPLAHGMMLVAVGEANKDREKYLGLSKTYRVNFLFGISTDTGDVLGVVNKVQKIKPHDAERAQEAILNIKGKHVLQYPIYSSKTVEGKPLHEYAREGKDVAVPERVMEVLSVTCRDIQKVSGKEIVQEGISATEQVAGDFRQDKIKKSWKEFLEKNAVQSFLVVDAILSVTGGTYIRSLVNLLSAKTSYPCLAYDIERIKIDL